MTMKYSGTDIQPMIGDHVMFCDEPFVVTWIIEGGKASDGVPWLDEDYGDGITISGPNTFFLYPPEEEDLEFVSRAGNQGESQS